MKKCFLKFRELKCLIHFKIRGLAIFICRRVRREGKYFALRYANRKGNYFP